MNMRRRSRYDEYYEDEEDTGGSFIPPQKFALVDYLVACALGLFAAVAVFFASSRGLHPDAWADCAVAAGLRQPESLVPGLWRPIGRAIYMLLGVENGNVAVSLLGKAALGAVVGFCYLSFMGMLSLLIRMPGPRSVWSRTLSRCVAALSAALFLCADPVWTLGYAFTPAALEILLFAVSLYFFVRLLVMGQVRAGYVAMFALGLVSAESPLGLISLGTFWMLFYILMTKGGLFHVKLLEPLTQQRAKWYLTAFWALGLMLGVAANVCGFVWLGGMAASGIGIGQMPLKYVVQLWRELATAAPLGAWVVGVGVSVTPFVLGIALLRKAADIEYFFRFHVGIVYFAVGVVAYSQLSSLHPLWFWRIADSLYTSNRILLYVFSFTSAASVMTALSAAVIDIYCRDHLRLASKINPDMSLDKERQHTSRAFKNVFCWSFAAILLLGAACGRWQPKTRAMLSLMDEYVSETVTEAEGAKWLFTDGSYDAAFELEAARRGKRLVCISVISTEAARSARALSLLMADGEDRLSAQVGGGNLLRTWQSAKPDRIDASAMQVGLEVWRVRGGVDYPPISGTLARTKWPSEEARLSGVERGRAFAHRILSFYAAGGPGKTAGRLVNELFLFMQWRVSRIARARAEVFDRTGRLEESLSDVALADRLDEENLSLKLIIEAMVKLREHVMKQMTPREGLHYALLQANFLLAKRYAQPILDADPDDPDANFGIGMSYYVQDQFSRAEEYLSRCLKRNPQQPAVWNNIAVSLLRMGKYDEAMLHAQRALELLPKSAEIMDTIRMIEKAKAEAEAAASTNAPAPAARPTAPQAR